MDLGQLRLFVAVAEEQHFTRAAARMNVSQPALTHRIRGLEDDLGVRLFERTSRGAVLTAAGASLLPDARRLLADAEASGRRARRAGGLADDLLRVGFDLVEFGSVGLMPSLLGLFRESFPQAEMRLSTHPPEELERELLADRLDICFVLGPPGPPGLRFYPLLQGDYALLLPAAHPLAASATVPRPALASLRVMLPRLRAQDDEALLSWLGAARAGGGVVRGVELAAMTGLVAAGEGVALLPSGLLTAQPVGGTVVRPVEGPPLPWQFGLMWPADAPTPMARLAARQIRQRVPRPTRIGALS